MDRMEMPQPRVGQIQVVEVVEVVMEILGVDQVGRESS